MTIVPNLDCMLEYLNGHIEKAHDYLDGNRLC